MSDLSYIPLLNSIAVNEAKGEVLLQTWANATTDPGLKAALQFVAIREGMAPLASGDAAGSGRETAIRSLQAAGLEVGAISDVTPQPHNGCRPPKRRRV